MMQYTAHQERPGYTCWQEKKSFLLLYHSRTLRGAGVPPISPGLSNLQANYHGLAKSCFMHGVQEPISESGSECQRTSRRALVGQSRRGMDVQRTSRVIDYSWPCNLGFRPVWLIDRLV